MMRTRRMMMMMMMAWMMMIVTLIMRMREQVGKLVAFISSLVRGNAVEPEVSPVFLFVNS